MYGYTTILAPVARDFPAGVTVDDFRRALVSLRHTPYEAAEEIGVRPETILRWLGGIGIPQPGPARKLTKYVRLARVMERYR